MCLQGCGAPRSHSDFDKIAIPAPQTPRLHPSDVDCIPRTDVLELLFYLCMRTKQVPYLAEAHLVELFKGI